MVFGKMIHPISSLSQLNASNQIVWQVLNAGRDGELPPTKAPGKTLTLLDQQFCNTYSEIVWIDVEDLAETSRKVLIFPATGHERFLVTQSSYDTQEILSAQSCPKDIESQLDSLGGEVRILITRVILPKRKQCLASNFGG